ncbi:hypothetical protein OF83DRAFT_1287153 [Amylostereum chailletii]|nr:hypothetical protein OF83DRAFT_1287153 [Amylostereum chailletii]
MDIMLGVRPATNEKPYSQLDQLYLQVLRAALPSDTGTDVIERFHWVVGCIVLMRDSICKTAFTTFTKYSLEQISHTLSHLQSIILSPENPMDVIRPVSL